MASKEKVLEKVGKALPKADFKIRFKEANDTRVVKAKANTIEQAFKALDLIKNNLHISDAEIYVQHKNKRVELYTYSDGKESYRLGDLAEAN